MVIIVNTFNSFQYKHGSWNETILKELVNSLAIKKLANGIFTQ